MTEHGHARIDADLFLDALADLDCGTDALRYDDHEVRVARKAGILNALHHVALEIELMFGNEHRRRADRNADIQSKEARIPTHHLDDRTTLMGLHRVAQLIDTVDRRVAGGIKADRIIRAANVVVNRCRDADRRNTEPRKLQRAAERSVAADRHDSVESEHLTGRNCTLASLFGHKIFAARRIQDRAAAGQRMADVLAGKFDKVAENQSCPTSADTDTFDAIRIRRTDNRAHCSVHTRCIAAACQNTDSFDLLFHRMPSSCLLWNITERPSLQRYPRLYRQYLPQVHRRYAQAPWP